MLSQNRLCLEPAFVRGLHHGSATPPLFIKIAPCRPVARLGRIGLKTLHDPTRARQLLAAELNSAVVVPQLDRRFEAEIREIALLVNQECVDLEWMSVAGTYDGSLLDGP